MHPSEPYRFYEVWVPKRAPFNTDVGWPAIVGEFIAPIVYGQERLTYWFVQEGRHFQFCFSHPHPPTIEAAIRKQCRLKRFTVKRIIRGTVGGALGGRRWISEDLIGTGSEGWRSAYVLRAMHGVCALYIHSLVRRGKVWGTERNTDPQNPHRNLFESLMHLVANTTGARFDVFLNARTGWSEFKDTRVTLHL